MKLRIKSNSLRYRITKTEMANLLNDGYLKEVVNFGDDEMVYVLQSIMSQELSADFKNNIITIYIPEAMIQELANTDKVGVENKGSHLHLLIEKDFTCLDNVDEDQSDNYPNPLVKKSL